MWQCRVEIEHYSVAYFNRIIMFEALSSVLPLRVGIIHAAKLHECIVSLT